MFAPRDGRSGKPLTQHPILMEGIVFLLLLAAVVLLILPIAAFVRAGQAWADAEKARALVDRATERLALLEKELLALKQRTVPIPEPIPEPGPQPAPATEALPAPAPVAFAVSGALPTARSAPLPPLASAIVPRPPVSSQAPTLSAQTTISRPIPAPGFSSVPPEVPPMAPAIPAASPTGISVGSREVEAAAPGKPAFNWEQFIGVKLFAWIAGIAIFLAAGYFLQWSFEHNYITPPVRVAMGLVTGLGLLAGGLCLPRARYGVMVQSLTSAGVLVLYASIFAASSPKLFDLFGNGLGFGCMALVTVAAFLLATRLEAPAVAVLGLLGGFLTPVLLATGEDHPLSLFGYVGLLDVGLLAVALRKRWSYLTPLAAGATALMQSGWVLKFFTPDKMTTGMMVFVGFAVLFGLIAVMADRNHPLDRALQVAALSLPAAALLFAFYLVLQPDPGICAEPWRLFGFVFAVDAIVLAIATARRELRLSHAAAGGAVFLLLALWTQDALSNALLNRALALYLVFGVVHAVYPGAVERWRPSGTPQWMGHLAAPLALLLVFIPLFKLTTLSLAIWPAILLVDLLAILLAATTFALLGVFAVLLLTMAAAACWILRGAPALTDLPETLVIVGGFAVIFFMASFFLAQRMRATPAVPAGAGANPDAAWPWDFLLQPSPELARTLVPTLSGLLPFARLLLMVLRLPLADPSPVFGLAALMTILMLGLVRFQGVPGTPKVARFSWAQSSALPW